jgi:hypothetical protein
MKRNTPEFIDRSKILCQLITPKLGTEVSVQVDSGTIYSVVRGVITEIPGGRDGWDYKVLATHTVSSIFFSIDDVVDVIGRNIYLGNR